MYRLRLGGNGVGGGDGVSGRTFRVGTGLWVVKTAGRGLGLGGRAGLGRLYNVSLGITLMNCFSLGSGAGAGCLKWRIGQPFAPLEIGMVVYRYQQSTFRIL